jgi:hypothetical protein
MTLKISTTTLQKCFSIFFVMLPFFAIAQDSFDDDTDDITPAVPIDDYIFIVLAIGVYLAYRIFKTQIHNTTKN